MRTNSRTSSWKRWAWRTARNSIALLTVLGTMSAPTTTLAQDTSPAPSDRGVIDPVGVYFHEFTGFFDGSEWARFFERPGDRRYNFHDLQGDGAFDGAVTEAGLITLDSGNGVGQFSDMNNAEIDLTLGGPQNWRSVLRRVPHTGPDFPVKADTTLFGDECLAGAWDAVIETIDPRTELVTASTTDAIQVTILGRRMRIDLSNGDYYQGVFTRADQVGFRVIQPRPNNPEFRSFQGSRLSQDLNLVGEARIASRLHFTAVLLLQSRTPVGTQAQTFFYLTACRRPPPGDLDDGGTIDVTDLGTLLANFGSGSQPDQGDVTGDGAIDLNDLEILLSNFGWPCAQ